MSGRPPPHDLRTEIERRPAAALMQRDHQPLKKRGAGSLKYRVHSQWEYLKATYALYHQAPSAEKSRPMPVNWATMSASSRKPSLPSAAQASATTSSGIVRWSS